MAKFRRFLFRNTMLSPAVDADGLGVWKIKFANRAMASGEEKRCRMNGLEMTLEIGEIHNNVFTIYTIYDLLLFENYMYKLGKSILLTKISIYIHCKKYNSCFKKKNLVLRKYFLI